MNESVQPLPEILLEARNVTKRYPGNVALDRVTYRVYRNQVNVLIGENGAGKSTLMRILSGVEYADEGELFLDGRQIVLHSPRDAAAYGIAIMIILLTKQRVCRILETSEATSLIGEWQ